MSSTIADWEKKRTLERAYIHMPAHIRKEFIERVQAEQDAMDKANAKKDECPGGDMHGNDFLVKDGQEPSISVEAPEEPVSLKTKSKKPEKVQDARMVHDGDDRYVPGKSQATADAQPAGEPHETDGTTNTDLPDNPVSGGGSASAEGSDFLVADPMAKEDEPEDEKPGDEPKPFGEATMTGVGMVTPRPMLITTQPGTEVVPDNFGYSAQTSDGTDNGHTHLAYYDSEGNGQTSMDDGHSHPIRSFQVGDYQSPDGSKAHGHPGILPRPEDTPGSEFKNYDGQVTGKEQDSSFGTVED